MTADSPGNPGKPERFEWDAPVAGATLRTARDAGAVPPELAAALSPAPSAANVRDQYIATRFPGLAQSGTDLEDAAAIIAGARLYFDEGKTDRALELLDLAIEQCPFDEPLRLARLEIAFLLRDAALYTALAEEFRRIRGPGIAWLEISRLGRAVAPDAPIFGSKEGQRSHDHYGPWPDTPNWLNASWDLTPEILAADYHRLMARNAPHSGARPLPLPPRTTR